MVAVPPLSLPPPGPCTPEVLATSEAGQLYAVHARMVDPGFSVTTETAPVIATICQRLDGLPLAIELAAARSRTLTPQQLLARLPRGLELLDTNRQDLTGHQRAVQSTIAWSYDLLTPECQRVFHHLGVFSNGFPLDAALAIHGDLPEMTVLDALESLLDNSLLQRTMRPDGELRFFMLETIRMFALDRLAQSPDNAAAHVSHVEWAVALAEQTPLGLMGDADRHVYARLEREHDNLRSAMQWSLQHGNPEHCLRIANAIWSFWQHRGYLAEGSDWLDRSLHACSGSPVQLRARALLGRAFLAYSQDDLATSDGYASQSLAMYREIDRPVGIGFCLLCLSLVAEARGDLHPAIGYLTTALSLFRQEHRSFFEAHTIMTLGRLHFSLNDLPRAATHYREALALQRSIGNQMSTALTLDALGELSIESGNLPEAFSHFKQGRDIWRQLDHPWGLAESIAGIGLIAAHLGMWETAARLTGSAIARFASIQAQLTPVSRRTVARTMVSVRAGLGSVDALTYRDSGKTLPIDEIDRQISDVADHLWNRSASSAPSAQAPFSSTAHLTARESDVLDLLIQGHSNRAIADALFISVPTVKVHITHILDKLQLPSRAAVIAHVLGSGNETGTTRN